MCWWKFIFIPLFFCETGSDEDEEQITPGFRIHLSIDSLCVNVVQATTGEDPVFNLKLNKLLPTPSISVLSLRYIKR